MLLVWRQSTNDLLATFAIASVAGRLWTYHKNYDNVMLVFLLVALARTAWQRDRSTVARWMFWVVGISLWTPSSLAVHLPFQIFAMVAWIVGAAVIAAKPIP